MPFKPAASLTEQIANHLGEEIIKGNLEPLERIQELRVAKDLGVSRGSVREALLILEGRHLIDIIPRRGAVVSELAPTQLDGLFELYATLLGTLMSRLAVVWRDNQLGAFEDTIVTLRRSGGQGDLDNFTRGCFTFVRLAFPLVRNQYLHSVMEDLLPATQRAAYRVLLARPNQISGYITHYEQLLDAVRARDTELVTRLIRKYTDQQKELAIESVLH